MRDCGARWRVRQRLSGRIAPMTRLRYRWRTRLRRRLPWALVELGLARKGRGDGGAHEFYNCDGVVERCYHCEVGVRPYDARHFAQERA